MTAGVTSRRSPYPLFLGFGWVLLALAAGIYSYVRGIAWALAIPMAAAFLLEFPFYVLPGFDSARTWLERRCGNPANGRLAALQTLSAVLPWIACSLAGARINPTALALLTAIAGIVAFWYVIWPASRIADALFLAILAAIILSRIFDRIYPMPVPKLSISILGHLMLIRVAALSVLSIRGNSPASFRFLPNRREWLAGLRFFLFMLPVAGAAYVALGLAELRPHPQSLPIAAGTFLGILWVVALSEEFFFRGLMMNWFAAWSGSAFGGTNVALIVTSVLFGAVHLGFRFHGGFPNWRFATVAAIAGFFYGLAARSTGTIQASIVTHALTVTTWRVFLH